MGRACTKKCGENTEERTWWGKTWTAGEHPKHSAGSLRQQMKAAKTLSCLWIYSRIAGQKALLLYTFPQCSWPPTQATPAPHKWVWKHTRRSHKRKKFFPCLKLPLIKCKSWRENSCSTGLLRWPLMLTIQHYLLSMLYQSQRIHLQSSDTAHSER